MLKTLERERTEKQAALSANGNGMVTQSRNGLAGRVYSTADERVKAVLALELVKIENALEESVGWLHEGMCTCAQCLHEMSRQRRLCQAKLQIEAELARIENGVGA